MRLRFPLLRLPRTLRRPASAVAHLGVLFLPACSPGYVLRAGWEEAQILAHRRPIPEVIADPETDPELRGKLEFARRELGLKAARSFQHYSEIRRDTLALVLSASPPDRLAAKTWWFPIVGRVPYLGFFDPAQARRKEAELRAEGLDTYLRPTAAFSTLGWLPDPLLSTTLRDDSLGLAETVIHELTHNTVFVRGEIRFNESLANFVGLTGAAAFFCRKDLESACQDAEARWHDAVLVSEQYDALADSLTALYERGLPRPQLLEQRAALLERFTQRYREETIPRMRSRVWARLDFSRLNNASFLARHLYYRRLREFDAAYRRGPDLPAVLERLRERLRRSDDPWAALESERAAGS